MKKLILSGWVLMLAVAIASAGISISWNASYGAYSYDAPNTEDYDCAILDNSVQVLWALIFSTSDSYGYDQLTADAAGNISYGSGTVFSTRLFTGDNGLPVVTDYAGGSTDDTTQVWDSYLWGTTAQYTDATWTQAGYLYQAVFQYTEDGSIYAYLTAGQALDTSWVTGNKGQEIRLDIVPGDGNSNTGIQPWKDISAIPEPTTMALLGLGGLVMAIRRRRA
jgi:hypothetical protein